MKFTKKINNFVGGYAHAGTRAIQSILCEAGVYVGEPHRRSATYHDWATYPIIEKIGKTGHIDKEQLKYRFDFFKEDYDGMYKERENWSCKNSEMIVYPCLEALEFIVPGYTFILPMRDPRDNILIELPFAEKYKGFMDQLGDMTFWEKRMTFYNFVHDYAFSFFRDKKERLLIMYLEELVARPEKEIGRMFDFLGINDDPKKYTHIIEGHHRPCSIGRHKEGYTFHFDERWEDHTTVYTYSPEDHKDHWLWKTASRWLNREDYGYQRDK